MPRSSVASMVDSDSVLSWLNHMGMILVPFFISHICEGIGNILVHLHSFLKTETTFYERLKNSKIEANVHLTE